MDESDLFELVVHLRREVDELPGDFRTAPAHEDAADRVVGVLVERLQSPEHEDLGFDQLLVEGVLGPAVDVVEERVEDLLGEGLRAAAGQDFAQDLLFERAAWRRRTAEQQLPLRAQVRHQPLHRDEQLFGGRPRGCLEGGHAVEQLGELGADGRDALGSDAEGALLLDEFVQLILGEGQHAGEDLEPGSAART